MPIFRRGLRDDLSNWAQRLDVNAADPSAFHDLVSKVAFLKIISIRQLETRRVNRKSLLPELFGIAAVATSPQGGLGPNYRRNPSLSIEIQTPQCEEKEFNRGILVLQTLPLIYPIHYIRRRTARSPTLSHALNPLCTARGKMGCHRLTNKREG